MKTVQQKLPKDSLQLRQCMFAFLPRGKQALDTVTACAKANGLDVRATAVSPIEGTHGNIEYLLYAVA